MKKKSEMEDQSRSNPVLDLLGRCDRENVAGTEIHPLAYLAGETNQTFKKNVPLAPAVQRRATRELQMEIHRTDATIIMTTAIPTKSVDKTQPNKKLGGITVKRMLNPKLRIQSEIPSQVIPHRNTRSQGGLPAKRGGTRGKNDLHLAGQKEIRGIDKENPGNHRQVTDPRSRRVALDILEDVRNLHNHTEPVVERPLQLKFNLMFRKTIAFDISVTHDKIPAGQRRLDPEGMHIGNPLRARMRMNERTSGHNGLILDAIPMGMTRMPRMGQKRKKDGYGSGGKQCFHAQRVLSKTPPSGKK